jgi:hypothetical protein
VTCPSSEPRFSGEDLSYGDRNQDPLLSALARWLDNYRELVAAQLQTRSSLGPNSIGAVEAALRQVDRACQDRSQGFGNRWRLNLLLDLMTLHPTVKPTRGAGPTDYASDYTHPAGSHPASEPHGGQGRPSLLA